MSELKAIFDTSKGKINISLFADKVPYTVASFTNLVKRGYYDGLVFHRVIVILIAQMSINSVLMVRVALELKQLSYLSGLMPLEVVK